MKKLLKKFLSLVMSVTISLSAIQSVSALPQLPPSWKDVNEQTVYARAIEWAHNKGIMKGYDDDYFRPGQCINRAEFLKVLLQYQKFYDEKYDSPKYNDVPTSADMTTINVLFKDVKEGSWFYDYVREAKFKNYINGYEDGYFRPNACVNRAEALKMATNILFHRPDLKDYYGMVSYDDKYVIDIKSWDWFSTYANFLFRKRLVGTTHTTFAGITPERTNMIKFHPEQPMTRQEVAEMVFRIDGYLHPSQAPFSRY